MSFELEIGCFAVYATRGRCANSERSRKLADLVKKGVTDTIQICANHINNNEHGEDILKGFLGPDVALVPVPRSSPLKDESLWPARVICDVFKSSGLGNDVFEYVNRITPIPNSRTAGWGNRPTVTTHLESLVAQRTLEEPVSITLIDDVITKGHTSYACALKLSEIFPKANIRAFAIFATRGMIETLDSVIDPCVGTIKQNSSGHYDRLLTNVNGQEYR